MVIAKIWCLQRFLMLAAVFVNRWNVLLAEMLEAVNLFPLRHPLALKVLPLPLPLIGYTVSSFASTSVVRESERFLLHPLLYLFLTPSAFTSTYSFLTAFYRFHEL